MTMEMSPSMKRIRTAAAEAVRDTNEIEVVKIADTAEVVFRWNDCNGPRFATAYDPAEAAAFMSVFLKGEG